MRMKSLGLYITLQKMALSIFKEMVVGSYDCPSKRVNIYTEKGIVKAVFGWPAIHTRHKKEDTIQV